jgi:hypothetical protein
MIGRELLGAGIRASVFEHGGDSRASFRALGFDNLAVDEQAERLVALYRRSGVTYDLAVPAAFTAGLELGYRVAQLEREGS